MLDRRATVHHDIDPRRSRRFHGFLVDNPQLQPHCRCLDPDGRLDHGRNIDRAPEDVDQVHLLRHVIQSAVRFLAKDRAGELWIDRNDPVTLTLQVSRDAVTRALGSVREAYHRDHTAARQDRFDCF